MADVTAGEGLAVSAPRKTFGQEAVALWRRMTSRRHRSEVVVPVATGDDARVDDAVVEGVVEEVAAKAALTRENFADASAEDIVEFLKGLDVEPTEGAERPEAERGEFGFFGVKLTDDEKAAVLRLRIGAPAVEGEEDTTAADVALLRAKFAIPTSSEAVVDGGVVETTVLVDESADADADLTARTAELLALADRFAITTKDRAALALLVGMTEFSVELKRIIADMHSAWKEQVDSVPVADVAEDEAPLPLAFEERAQATFDALIAALEARQSEAPAPADVEQVQALVVEENDRQEDEVVVVEGADDEVREGETDVVVAVEAGDDHVGDNRAD